MCFWSFSTSFACPCRRLTEPEQCKKTYLIFQKLKFKQGGLTIYRPGEAKGIFIALHLSKLQIVAFLKTKAKQKTPPPLPTLSCTAAAHLGALGVL